MNQNPDGRTVALAFELLKNFSIEEIRNSLLEHLKDPLQGKFMPKPAQIIERIKAERKRNDVYIPLALDNNEVHVRSVVARNECMFHIKKLLPKFMDFEEREEEKRIKEKARNGEV